MRDALASPRARLTVVNAVVVVAALYWAQAVIVPVTLALLLTFILSLVVAPLQRRIGSVPAVLLVVVVTFAALGVAGWAVSTQLTSLIQELPGYQQNVRHKIRDIRWMGKGGPVETLQETVEDIQSEIARTETTGTTAKPVVVETHQVASLWGLPTTVGPWLEPLATASLVLALVIFMLLERQDLRDRLISLFGHGQLTVTTRAFDEAGRRVSRYLVAQSLINLFFGIGVGVGLWAIGVPYALLWGALAVALRFIPYVGPWIAAAAPILVSLAAFDGWTRPLLVVGLYAGLELLTNFVVESIFYADAAGVSQVGLLIAVAFWAWLWGPMGLLMATPLTVCLVVLGKYVPGFEVISTLLADETVLDSHLSYYQRLLAGDQAEATEIVEQYVKGEAPETVYDAIVVPALNFAERDRMEGRLSIEEEAAIVDASRAVLEDVPDLLAGERTAGDAEPTVLGWPVHGAPDTLALHMLGALLRGAPVAMDTMSDSGLLADGIRLIRERGYRAVCIGDLPPSRPSKSRHLVKRLRAALPELTIVVGRWAAPSFADADTAMLMEAGADAVGSTLVETRDQLVRRVHLTSDTTPARTAVSDGRD